MRHLPGADLNAAFRFSPILLTLALALVARAYEYPLSPEAIREAYFFTRSNDRAKVAGFLGQYIRRFRPKVDGPDVGAVELHTPYQQVVRRSWENQTGYSAQQAQADYAIKPEFIEVRAFLYLGGSRAGPYDL